MTGGCAERNADTSEQSPIEPQALADRVHRLTSILLLNTQLGSSHSQPDALAHQTSPLNQPLNVCRKMTDPCIDVAGGPAARAGAWRLGRNLVCSNGLAPLLGERDRLELVLHPVAEDGRTKGFISKRSGLATANHLRVRGSVEPLHPETVEASLWYRAHLAVPKRAPETARAVHVTDLAPPRWAAIRAIVPWSRDRTLQARALHLSPTITLAILGHPVAVGRCHPVRGRTSSNQPAGEDTKTARFSFTTVWP